MRTHMYVTSPTSTNASGFASHWKSGTFSLNKFETSSKFHVLNKTVGLTPATLFFLHTRGMKTLHSRNVNGFRAYLFSGTWSRQGGWFQGCMAKGLSGSAGPAFKNLLMQYKPPRPNNIRCDRKRDTPFPVAIVKGVFVGGALSYFYFHFFTDALLCDGNIFRTVPNENTLITFFECVCVCVCFCSRLQNISASLTQCGELR